MKHSTSARAAALACAVLMTTTGLTAPAAATPRLGDVQAALEALAANAGVVGAIGEVYVDGKRAGQGSAGSRLLDGEGGRIPADSRFRIGSQTKRMTATIVLQLVEEGRLGLEDKLADVLPEVVAQDAVERAGEITVRQLIRHTSGIPNWFDPALVDIYDTTTYIPPMDLVKKSRSRPRTGEPGEKFTYSNTNYTLLGMIIERVTGHALAAEFSRRLFAPLKMSRTYLPARPPQGIKGPHGHGYHTDAQGVRHDMHRLNASYGNGAGGVVSTARDVSAFSRAFQQGRLLPADLQRVITDPPDNAPAPPPPSERLCGGEPALQAQAGGAPGFNAVTFTTSDGRLQFALSVTTSTDSPLAISRAINGAAEAVICPGR
ncbi:serine hydrolase domain-containing protein [Nonomuraea sp. SYSU D8015]|uniref:serine hydrolase domain-containing protein n=1 Tax=Nonomuraea sp. SYSU D8015 TaxID=2593644 RepID=UPI001660CB86|nr:serine hydrolase domain-containing protein [Nonomuraea sp. SYSU D8015]